MDRSTEPEYWRSEPPEVAYGTNRILSLESSAGQSLEIVIVKPLRVGERKATQLVVAKQASSNPATGPPVNAVFVAKIADPAYMGDAWDEYLYMPRAETAM